MQNARELATDGREAARIVSLLRMNMPLGLPNAKALASRELAAPFRRELLASLRDLGIEEAYLKIERDCEERTVDAQIAAGLNLEEDAPMERRGSARVAEIQMKRDLVNSIADDDRRQAVVEIIRQMELAPLRVEEIIIENIRSSALEASSWASREIASSVGKALLAALVGYAVARGWCALWAVFLVCAYEIRCKSLKRLAASREFALREREALEDFDATKRHLESASVFGLPTSGLGVRTA